MPNMTMRRIFFAALPSVFALVIFGLGFVAGRYQAGRSIRRQIVASAASDTLGRMLSEAEKASHASAYENPELATREMDHFSYAVRNVLTPFVGSGPEPGQHANAFINSMQFRSSKEVAMPKPPGVYRIFVTGGSTAFGAGAPSQDSIISQYLENLLNAGTASSPPVRYEAFTLANPAWTSTHERIIIENRLSELSPDMIISLSGINDVHWAGAGRDVFWFRPYADQHFWDLLNTARKIAGVPSMTDIISDPSPVDPVTVATRLEKNVRLSAMAVGLKGAHYVFVLQPALAITSKPLSIREEKLRARLLPPALENFTKSYQTMKSRLQSIHADQFLYLDQSDAFAGLTASDEIFFDSYHFGDRGNAIVAKKIADGIQSILSQPVR
jgi:lysophospholipase L1-like esterase